MQNSSAHAQPLEYNQLEDRLASGAIRKAELGRKEDEVVAFLRGDLSREKPWRPIGSDGMPFWHEVRWRIEMKTGWEWMRVEAEIIAFNTLAAIGFVGVMVVIIETIWG